MDETRLSALVSPITTLRLLELVGLRHRRGAAANSLVRTVGRLGSDPVGVGQVRGQVTEGALALSLALRAGIHRCEQFGYELMKSKKDSTSNWERRPLRLSQIAYAAQDAWVSVWLCRQLFLRWVLAVPGLGPIWILG
jgi:hypothetical protein